MEVSTGGNPLAGNLKAHKSVFTDIPVKCGTWYLLCHQEPQFPPSIPTVTPSFLKELVKNRTQLKIRRGILKVLAYFDLFDYPVLKEEILFFFDHPASRRDIDSELDILIAEEHLFSLDEFYSLRNEPKLVERRRVGNKNAQDLLVTGKKIAGHLFQFPFVRGIGISGSLSKNFAEENADIDYFIITKENRLWLARSMMHLLKKFSFLTGRQDWYCMNYYVDEGALEIEEKNIFTAIELITLMPIYGNGAMDEFFQMNDWASAFYPNYISRTRSYKSTAKHSFLKRMIEGLFNNRLGDKLDVYLMKLTAKRWKKKEEQRKTTPKGDRMGLRTGRHFSKPNPVFFQKKILNRYVNKLNELSPRWEAEYQ